MQQRSRAFAGELRAPGELGRLVANPIWYGAGATRGDGRPVLVLPGLFGNDLYLMPLHGWLMRLGYRPVLSTLALNAGCPETLRVSAQRSLDGQLRPGQRAAIIGHSRGGMLGWAIASALGEQVSRLVLLGSPAAAVASLMGRGSMDSTGVAASRVAEASNIARRILSPRCNVPECGCPYVADMRRPLHAATKVTSIYSTEDPIVPASACRVAGAENIEVHGSHSGLAQNVEVYRVLARVLAT